MNRLKSFTQANFTRSKVRTVPVNKHIKTKGMLSRSITALLSVAMNREHSPAVCRTSVVPSVDDFPPSSSVNSQETDVYEKALIDFNRCKSESAEGWSSVGPYTHQFYISLTSCEGQEAICRQHLLPHCPQFGYCLIASRRSRLLYHRLFPRHR